MAITAETLSNLFVRNTDESDFRDSVRPRGVHQSGGFYEPSISSRGSRTLQHKAKRRSIWPRVALGLILVGALVLLWVRFGPR